MQEILLTVNQWISSGSILAAVGCFVWGMVSVLLSPCHMASIPLIVTYVAGQDKAVNTKQAAYYALSFTGGLFLTIAAIGIICNLLGRMLGDVGSYWTILVGAILIWVALDMLGVSYCSMSGSLLSRIKVQGLGGALVLGLAYGVLSGSCTFGFIAPILAIITIQQQTTTGILLIVLFGLGHSLPIVIAGSSIALVRKYLENRSVQQGSLWFKKTAGVTIGLLGIFFILRPFFEI